jgi:hypothetical protein
VEGLNEAKERKGISDDDESSLEELSEDPIAPFPKASMLPPYEKDEPATPNPDPVIPTPPPPPRAPTPVTDLSSESVETATMCEAPQEM